MSFETIVIHRDFPIINGFVQVPPNQETDKNRVTIAEAEAAIVSSTETALSMGSGHNTGWQAGAQSFLRLPGLTPGTSYVTNPVDALASS